jgi:hypothetical protein
VVRHGGAHGFLGLADDGECLVVTKACIGNIGVRARPAFALAYDWRRESG